MAFNTKYFPMKAVVHTQGRQFTVQKGDVIFVNRYQNTQTGDSISIPNVLLAVDGDKTTVGTPFIKGATVQASILENKRDKKIVIFKKKRRKGYRRKQGHRQEISVIRIESINL